MTATSVSLDGLTAAEVAERVADGRVNRVPNAPSRTVGEIIRANVLTPFNALILTLVALVVSVGAYQDALFGGVVIANSGIGIIQELRAKRALDKLAVLSAPVAHVIRAGSPVELAIDEIVLDDLIDLRPGAQVVADAVVVATKGLEIDESLLTGESDALDKAVGDELMSGSFVVSGGGQAQVTKVGADAYAAKLAEEARRFSLVNSELQSAIMRIVRTVSWLLIPVGSLLVWTQFRQSDDFDDAVVKAVAGMVAMVPEGLILLTSVAFAVGVLRLAKRQTLVQELPAVEMLARVDVVCLDKTGTITEGTMELDDVRPIEVVGNKVDVDLATVVAALAWADPNPNPTQQALADRYPDAPDGWQSTELIAFSSARKWSAACFGDHGWWVLGAAEMMLDDDAYDEIAAQVEECAAAGLRVLLLARCDEPISDATLPPVYPTALVLLMDKIREDAPDTLRYFDEQGVTLKVISGDNASTVAAVSARAGLRTADRSVDARQLPTDPAELSGAVEETTVFGRVTPHQKQAMVKALQDQGHVVAMTGDGVNDVLALKDADIGIAMASGSEASRAVAQIVLMDSTFSGLPAVVLEGRRVINNLQRVASLYLTKTTYAILLAAITAVAGITFPFLPRQLTLISTLCIGVPSFFLALAPNNERVQGDFLRRAARDSIPYGVICTLATLASYLYARSADLTEMEIGTAATLTLAGCSLVVLWRNARPMVPWKAGLVMVMGLAVLGAFTIPVGRTFFELDLPSGAPLWVAVGTVGIGAIAMVIVHHLIPVEEPDTNRVSPPVIDPDDR